MVVLLLIVITLIAAMWERKRRYDQFIRESELRFRAQYKSTPVATFTLKCSVDEFVLVDANDAAYALTSGTIASWVGRPLQALRHFVPDSVAIVERCFAERAVLHQELSYAFAGKHRATDLALTYAYVKPDMVLVHVEDVTERRQAEMRNRESREQLRALAARLESIREEERTQLSREIHDELGQLMTGLKMDLAWIRKRIAEFGEQAATAMTARVQQMNTLLDDSIQTVRKISGQLRPALLDALGLIAAIEWQAKEWQTRTGILCQVDVLIDEPHMSKEHATELFRIFQELLTNIGRHAGASEAGVILESVDDGLSLEVRDNGRGITEDEVNRRLSLGILGMEERAARLGGHIRFTGIPGHGTTVRVTIPLKQVEK
jgi:signal transduction histidine kinase